MRLVAGDPSFKGIMAARKKPVSTMSLADAGIDPGKVGLAKLVGQWVAKRALEKGVTQVAFDRAGYQYHGRVKALAEGAREAGLAF